MPKLYRTAHELITEFPIGTWFEGKPTRQGRPKKELKNHVHFFCIVDVNFKRDCVVLGVFSVDLASMEFWLRELEQSFDQRFTCDPVLRSPLPEWCRHPISAAA